MTHCVASSCAKALRDFPVPSRPEGAEVARRLSAQEIATISKARETRWRPGLEDQPWHSEIFASARDASGAGLALALARDALGVAAGREDPAAEPEDRRHILWVQDARAIRLGGRPYLHGLPKDLRERLIHVEAKTSEDALFALEEGLRCRDLACVIGEIVGNPRALDFIASRRLSLAAEKHAVALWLVRLEAQADLSSARMRWRAEPAPSACPRWNAEAPGHPSWRAELFRARSNAPGEWIVSDDETTLTARRPNQDEQRETQRLGPALARQRRFWYPGGASTHAVHSSTIAHIPKTTPDPCHLVRATIGRSLAARARM
ncbi:MAG: recA-like protein [Erythrobacter sp.]|uniref:recA-like protein n=1 Tax=Erythrobacter sp. TaxID=1042 RepID=UPI0026049E89|nr:recA-like protein [Erythrobacter sp.]MDJ0977450.1 recA-like protein [Erythrobacter sp.]